MRLNSNTLDDNHASNSFTNKFSLFVILGGVLLALIQFFLNRSVWIDEAALGLNIIERDFYELLEPLDINQVAPIGFLAVEKLAVSYLGKNEMALRFFPLLCFLLSIPFYYTFVNKLVANKSIALISTGIFSISISLLRYSSEIKQYSSDVLICIIILFYTITLTFKNTKDFYFYALIGIVSVWFSNISIIVLFVAGLYLSYKELYIKNNYLLLLPIIGWMLSFGLYHYFFIRNHPTKDLMLDYWGNSFMPINPFSSSFISFCLASIKAIYSWLLGFGPAWSVPFIASGYGVWMLIKRKEYEILYFILSPLLTHLALSAFKLYPFSDRLILYLSPLIILLFVIGSDGLYKFFSEKIKYIPSFARLIPLLLFFVPLLLRYPIKKEEIKESLEYIKENGGENDNIYIYNASYVAYKFYVVTKIFEFKNKIIVGNSHRDDNSKYLDELAMIHGRTWLLFSHVYPFDKEDNEETFILNSIQESGLDLIQKFKTKGSSTYLIDFTNKP